MPYEEESQQHGQSVEPKLWLALHTIVRGINDGICENRSNVCLYRLFCSSCVASVAFVAHSRRIHQIFASCMCLYFVHCTSSNGVILVLVVDTCGTAAACLVVERWAHQDGDRRKVKPTCVWKWSRSYIQVLLDVFQKSQIAAPDLLLPRLDWPRSAWKFNWNIRRTWSSHFILSPHTSPTSTKPPCMLLSHVRPSYSHMGCCRGRLVTCACMDWCDHVISPVLGLMCTPNMLQHDMMLVYCVVACCMSC